MHKSFKLTKKCRMTSLCLLHPVIVMWDYFEYLIALMQDQFHLIIPAIPGYDEG